MKKNMPRTSGAHDLTQLKTPADLRALPAAEMPQLCEEIRQFLIEKVSESGGHLASNLGVVELSLALHRVFDAPNDHIIWDVGIDGHDRIQRKGV